MRAILVVPQPQSTTPSELHEKITSLEREGWFFSAEACRCLVFILDLSNVPAVAATKSRKVCGKCRAFIEQGRHGDSTVGECSVTGMVIGDGDPACSKFADAT
jgi:hypothetical protein